MSLINSTAIPSGATGYEIDQSLRFAGGNLSRTPSSASNRRKWSWSGWVKRAELGTYQVIWAAKTNTASIFWSPGNILRFEQYNGAGGYNFRRNFNPVMRDVSAWYHMLFIYDSAQGTETDRSQFYLNGVRQTIDYTYDAMPQNFESEWNNTEEHYIGNLGSWNYEGYVAEVHFIDGLVKAPADFGETGDYGEWKPIEYSGSYGTNGFYLPFKQDYTVEGFSTVTYTGTGATQYIGGTGFQSDFTWIKHRNEANDHVLTDSVRGVDNIFYANAGDAEATGGQITSFNSDGFVLEYSGGQNVKFNKASGTYVAWNWDMGGSNASNTNGSINSTVRANASYGQSIVSYTGNGVAYGSGGATVGHGLSSAPEFILVKRRDSGSGWVSYHPNQDGGTNGERGYMHLNESQAYSDYHEIWADTKPTASVFKMGSAGNLNANNGTYVAYCFHSVTGYSKIGSWVGNANDTAPVITTGFAPAFVMYKKATGAADWVIVDNTRNPSGIKNKVLYPNTNGAEVTSADAGQALIFTSTGFQPGGAGGDMNGNGETYIYMAFADKREYAYWLDQSGNNNDWTSNNLTESDVMVDSPTNNFCTLNPLKKIDVTLSEGNLKSVGGSGGSGAVHINSTFAMTTGKWYCEFYQQAVSTSAYILGIQKTTSTGESDLSYGYYAGNGNKYTNGGSAASYGASFTAGDIIGIAVDMDAGTLIFYKNNASQGTAFTSISGDYSFFGNRFGGSESTAVWNFGQDSSFAGNKTAQGNQDGNDIGDFYYAPPTGYLALCTSNLPDVAVIPSEHFNTVLYTGNGGTQSITGFGFQPDWIWDKSRNQTGSHMLVDAVRGVGKYLRTNLTSAEVVDSSILTSFDSDGVTVGDINGNASSSSSVMWGWKANGSGSSNTNGSITSTVSANTDAGFSILSYTGNGVDNATIGHSLGVKPDLIILKKRSGAEQWGVFLETLGYGSHCLFLESTSAAVSLGSGVKSGTNTSTIQLGQDGIVNASSATYIGYAFANVDGYSKVGSYTGNGNADGTFVYTGFRPAYVMIKKSSDAGDWAILDAKRNTYNSAQKMLRAQGNDAEADSSNSFTTDFTSNGFKCRATNGYFNASGGTYIYLAFAESPFKYSNAR